LTAITHDVWKLYVVTICERVFWERTGSLWLVAAIRRRWCLGNKDVTRAHWTYGLGVCGSVCRNRTCHRA